MPHRSISRVLRTTYFPNGGRTMTFAFDIAHEAARRPFTGGIPTAETIVASSRL